MVVGQNATLFFNLNRKSANRHHTALCPLWIISHQHPWIEEWKCIGFGVAHVWYSHGSSALAGKNILVVAVRYSWELMVNNNNTLAVMTGSQPWPVEVGSKPHPRRQFLWFFFFFSRTANYQFYLFSFFFGCNNLTGVWKLRRLDGNALRYRNGTR